MISVHSPELAQSVDVWAVWLGASLSVSRTYRNLLSGDEILRADRFAFEHLRISFEVSHGALRILLARYMKCAPRELAFAFGPRGKPVLCGDSRLQFNMAHSGGLAVFAFSLDFNIGVDIEEIREIPEIEQIARRYFCREEAAQLQSIAGRKQREEAFYRCWTRKESYLKAVGDGLSAPLDQFQVTLLPGSPAHFIHIGNNINAASTWSLQHIEPAQGYIGALAYQSQARKMDLHPPQQPQDFLGLLSS